MDKDNKLEDIVNNPSHYSENFSQEIIVTIIDWIKEFNDPIMGYLIGQHLKYIPRANKKDKEKGIYEDIEKSDFYWKELMEYIKSLKEGYKYIPKERGGNTLSVFQNSLKIDPELLNAFKLKNLSLSKI